MQFINLWIVCCTKQALHTNLSGKLVDFLGCFILCHKIAVSTTHVLSLCEYQEAISNRKEWNQKSANLRQQHHRAHPKWVVPMWQVSWAATESSICSVKHILQFQNKTFPGRTELCFSIVFHESQCCKLRRAFANTIQPICNCKRWMSWTIAGH